MSGEAVKAYVFLLASSWLQEPRATLPKEREQLASLSRLTCEKWDTVSKEVLQHFKEGKCTEHKGRLYNDTLLEISRKWENNQRPNNKNAKRTRINREAFTALDNDNANDNAIEIDAVIDSFPSRILEWKLEREWSAFRRIRVAAGKLIDEYNEELLIKELLTYKDNPEHIREMIEQSIKNNWFYLREPLNGKSNGANFKNDGKNNGNNSGTPGNCARAGEFPESLTLD